MAVSDPDGQFKVVLRDTLFELVGVVGVVLVLDAVLLDSVVLDSLLDSGVVTSAVD